jgi:hypothetical protein
MGMGPNPEGGHKVVAYHLRSTWIYQCARGDSDAFMQAPVEPPLKAAVSVAQVMWARDMIA